MAWRLLPALVLAILVIRPAPAQEAPVQETLPIGAFAGSWQGVSVADAGDAGYFGLEPRDLNVIITPQGDGFSIAWTALIRTGPPDDPVFERRAVRMVFRPVRLHVYEAERSGEPLEGGVLRWGRLEGDTLTTYEMTLTRMGGFELTSQHRSLTGDGMDVVYRRVRDDEPIRDVRAHLVRSAG
jgi:hypothetical protein